QVLQRFGRDQRVTLATLAQGAWAALLARHSGEQDVLFGGVTAGRPVTLEGAEETVGLFVNTVPVRVRVDADRPVAEWLGNLQEEQAAARTYEHAPLTAVHAASEVPRGIPLFHSLLAVENLQVDVLSNDGLVTIHDVRRHPSRAKCPLAVIIVPGQNLSLR